jgi:hypothetical protein
MLARPNKPLCLTLSQDTQPRQQKRNWGEIIVAIAREDEPRFRVFRLRAFTTRLRCDAC